MKRALLAVLLLGFAADAQAGVTVGRTDLITDNQGANPALTTDPNLVNAWGMSFSGTSPFWVSDNGTGLSTLYAVNPLTNIPVKQGLEVSIPGDGSVTGQFFNPDTTAFNNDRFLFVSEDGTISGWRGALGTQAEVLQTGSASNVYKGVTEASVGGHSYMYAANFRAGTVDVIKGDAGAPSLTGNFTDPNLPAGFAPFNIQNLGGRIYVTYALQDGAKHDDVAGAGNGFVDVFDTQGNFLGRIGSQGTLNSPWGLTIAPASLGSFAGDLLVGNFGDGHINIFNLANNTFVGQLNGQDGNPIAIDGLWGLAVGNNGSAGSNQKIYFTAGPDGESHGLFGVLTPVPEPASLGIGVMGVLIGVIAYRRRRAV